MSKQPRRHLSPQEKVAILKRHLAEANPSAGHIRYEIFIQPLAALQQSAVLALGGLQ
jgi:hypothetical protein